MREHQERDLLSEDVDLRTLVTQVTNATTGYSLTIRRTVFEERNHQGLANRIISPEAGHFGNAGVVQRRQRLGGMLNYYYFDTA